MQNLTNISKKSQAWSREFDQLIRAIGECKSKAEEDSIIVREVELLKPRLKDPKLDKKLLKELLVRLIYVEMLGHDASWGHVKALQACSETTLLTKKVAYLAASLFLNYKSDTIILVVNTLQNDLKSDNFLVVCTALSAVCKLIGPDLINAVLPSVMDLLTHPRELVRKKAVMAIHRFVQLDPTFDGPLANIDFDKQLRTALCDKDPSVMSAALCALYEVMSRDTRPYKGLIPSFVSILKQVAEHRLPKAFDYHRTPAPFIQIKLLKILAVLGASDKSASDNMYAVLADVMKRANTGHTIGNAIVYECVKTITSIYPNPGLLQSAAEMVSAFLKSSNHNLKYVGIDALARIVRINPKYAAEHQVAVIDCLEDPDQTLKAKTLELLFKMTKPSNVEVIVEKMLEYLRGVTDQDARRDVVRRIGELAERFAPDTQWFVDTMNQVFELGGDVVPNEMAHGLMRLIAEGGGEDDEAGDAALREQAVVSYLHLLEKPKLPDTLLQVICWVLGEYGVMAPAGAQPVMDRLCSIADTQNVSDTVRSYLLLAIGKLSAQGRCGLTAEASTLLHDAAHSRNKDLQQRALEVQALLSGPARVREAVLPPDASCEDLQVDARLPFLDGYVAEALANGAAPYISEEERFAMGIVRPSATEEAVDHTHSLRFNAYERPTLPTGPIGRTNQPSPARGMDINGPGGAFGGGGSDLGLGVAAAAGSGPAPAPREPEVTLRTSGARKWGPAQMEPPPPPAASRAAAPAAVGWGTQPAPAQGSSRAEPKGEPLSGARQKLAASLFGDTGASSGRPARRAPAAKARSPERGSAAAAGAPAAAVAASAPAAAGHDMLLDLGDAPVQAAAAAQPADASADPFMQLQGLTVPPAAPAGMPAAPAAKPALDLDSLYGMPAAPVADPLLGLTQGQAPGLAYGQMGTSSLPLQAAPAGMMASPFSVGPGAMAAAPPVRPAPAPMAGAPPSKPAPPPQPKKTLDPFADLLG